MNRFRYLSFPLALALILGGLTAWLGRVSDVQIEEVKLPPNEPQYTGFALSAKRFDTNGGLIQQLDSPKGWQLPDQKNVFFDKLYLQIFTEGIQQYSVLSDTARYELESKKVFLKQNVILNKAQTEAHPAAHVYTDWLDVDTQTQVATTSAPVQYEYGQSRGTSVGAIYDNKREQLNLPARVRATIYETER